MNQYDVYQKKVTWDFSEPLHLWLARRIVKNFQDIVDLNESESRVLEIGSGTGRLARVFLDQGWKSYSAIEPTTTLANATRALNQEISVYENYLPDIPEELFGSKDLVVSLHVIEHADGPYAARQWLDSMVKCLSPGGYLLIACPDIRDWKNAFWYSDWSHGWPSTPQRVVDLGADLDLELVHAGDLYIGSRKALMMLAARAISMLIPVRIGDWIGMKLVGRPIASGIKQALLWGLTFVILRKQ